MKKISPSSWITFGQIFQGDVDDSHILVMSALLGITGIIPLEAEGSDYKMARVRQSDDAIIKKSFSMLKSTDFIEMILDLHPAKLSSTKFEHLCSVNSKLSELVDFRKQAERHKGYSMKLDSKNLTAVDRVDHDEDAINMIATNERNDENNSLKFQSESERMELEGDENYRNCSVLAEECNSDSRDDSSAIYEQNSIGFDYFEHTTFNILVNFLDKLQGSALEMNTKIALDQKATLRERSIAASIDVLNKALNAHIHELKQGYRRIESEHDAYNTELTKNRNKLKKLLSLRDERDILLDAFSQSMHYLRDELSQIDTILKYLVADSCVAASILVRSGWLPEQIRQECHDKMKDYMQVHGVDHSDSPYVLGCMVDRLQVRNWTQYTKGYFPRDVQSINSMSLLFLSPFYTFVIDPEGVAEKAIINALSSDYECFVVKGNIFSLVDLEKHLTVFNGRLSDDEHLGFTVIVTDLQSGVTDDLVSFLSAEIDQVPAAAVNRDRRKPSVMNNSALSNEAGIAFNPSFHNEFSPQNVIQLSKFRVIVLSTHPPTLDNNGVGSPLPPSCLKQMIVMHWISSIPRSLCVDAKILDTALKKDHCGSSLLENVMIASICRKISPKHLNNLNTINSRIIKYYNELASVETSAFDTIIDWTKFAVENQTENIRMEQKLYESSVYLQDYSPVKLGLLDSSLCLFTLKGLVAKRATLNKQILMAQNLERDRLLYISAFSDACGMASSFLQMAGSLLPENSLPPHTLTSVCIGAKCIQKFVDSTSSHRLLSRIPASLNGVKKLVDPLRKFQRIYAECYAKKKKNSTVHSSSGHTLSTSNSSDAPTNEKSNLYQRRKASVRRISVSTDRDISFLLRTSSFNEDSPSHSSLGPISPLPGRIMRESCFSRKSSKPPTERAKKFATMMQSLRLQDFLSVPHSERESLMSDLSVLLQPLHSLILNASVTYLLDNIKPGMEWLVKFCLVLTTWSASVPLPPEEIRLLFTLISNQTCGPSTYFQVSHSDITPVLVVDEEEHNEKSLGKNTNEKQNNFAVVSRESKTRVTLDGRRINVLAKHSPMRLDMFAQFTKGIRKNALISQRVRQLMDNSNQQKIIARPVRTKAMTELDSRSLDYRVATQTSWSGRGMGPIDGLWVCRRSLRYKIDYLKDVREYRTSVTPLCAGPKHKWDHVFCEGGNSAQIVRKNVLMRPTVRLKDEFLSEYLRIMEMKTWNSANEWRENFADSSTEPSRRSRRVSTVMAVKQCDPTSTAESKISLPSSRQKLLSSTTAKNNHKPMPPNSEHSPSAMASTSLRRAMQYRTVRKQSIDSRVEESSSAGSRKISSDWSHNTQAFGFLNRKQSMSTRVAIEQKAHLSGLLMSSNSVQYLKLLENHSNFGPIFRGLAEGISNHEAEFEEWKNFMESLVSIDFKVISEAELVKLAASVVPPQLNPDHLSDEDKHSVGCWALGKELTVLQTLILTCVLVPQAVEGAFEILFALLSGYMKCGNVIIKHRDELLEDENSDADGDGDEWDIEDWVEESSSEDELEDTKEEQFNDGGVISIAHLARKTNLKKGSFVVRNDPTSNREELLSNDSSEWEDEDEEGQDFVSDLKSSFHSKMSSSFFENNDEDRFQEGIFIFNSWTHMKRIVARKESGIRIRLSRKRSASLLCCRDFENWEEVLLSCLSIPNDTKKFQLITELRRAFDGQSPLFLSTRNSSMSTATLTTRAREYSNQNSVNASQMTVFNCRFQALEKNFSHCRINISHSDRFQTTAFLRDYLSRLAAVVTNRESSGNNEMRSTSVEMLDLNSSFGNRILSLYLTKGALFELKQGSESAPFQRFESGSSPNSGSLDAFYSTAKNVKRGLVFSKTPPSTTVSSSMGYSRGACNVLMSAMWSHKQSPGEVRTTKHFGTGPALTVGMLNFHWLSEHTIPDLIGCAKISSLSPGSSLIVSRDLSFGAIGDVVEGELHWAMNSLRRVANTRMTKAVRERIRYSTKIEMRMLACTLSLWKLNLSLECKLRELKNQPPQWTSFLEPLSLWQLARLVLKISDVSCNAQWSDLADDYNNSNCSTLWTKEYLFGFANILLKDLNFVKSICLIAESFSKLSFIPEDSEKGEQNEEGNRDEDKSTLPKATPSTTGTRSRLSMLVKQDSRNKRDAQQSKKGFLASYKASAEKKTTTKEFLLGEKFAAESVDKSTKVDKKEVSVKEKPSERRRRLREAKKAELIAAANSNYMSFESLSSANLFTLGPDSRLFMPQDMKNRFFSVLSVFFAGVIATNARIIDRERSRKSTTRTRTSSSDACQPIEKVKSAKSTNYVSDGRSSSFDEDLNENVWPNILPTHNDITVGSLMPHEVVMTLISWTFEGKEKDVSVLDSAKSKIQKVGKLASALRRVSIAEMTNDEKFVEWKAMNRLREKLAASSKK